MIARCDERKIILTDFDLKDIFRPIFLDISRGPRPGKLEKNLQIVSNHCNIL